MPERQTGQIDEGELPRTVGQKLRLDLRLPPRPARELYRDKRPTGQADTKHQAAADDRGIVQLLGIELGKAEAREPRDHDQARSDRCLDLSQRRCALLSSR